MLAKRYVGPVLIGAVALWIVTVILMMVASIFAPQPREVVVWQPNGPGTDVEIISPPLAPMSQYPQPALPEGTRELITTAVYGLFAAVLLGLLLITLFVVALLRRWPITQSRQVRGQMEVEETRIMQEINRSLGKMDSRIEALETLLLERPRTGEYSEPADRGTRRP